MREKIDTLPKLLDATQRLRLSKDFFCEDATEENFHTCRNDMRIRFNYFDIVKLRDCGLHTDTKSQDKYLHVSNKTDSLMVSFCESDEKCRRDIFTRMKFGKYLTKFHPEIDNEAVKKAVAKFEYAHGVPPDVQFGETKADFVRAINKGPGESCMAGFSFKGHEHPAVCYAAGDIKVAWIEDGDGRITARTIINKSTKQHSRTYGDFAKLDKLLSDAGYEKKAGALIGCRLLKIGDENGDGYLMPYVDAGVAAGGGDLWVTDEGDYWMLNDKSDGGIATYCGHEYGGVTEQNDDEDDEPEYGYCDRCGDGLHDDGDYRYSEYHGQSYCRLCADNYWEYAVVGVRRNNDNYTFDYVRSDDCTLVECLEEYVLSDVVDELDVVFDSELGEWIMIDDSVRDVSDDESYSSCDCVSCGETNGDTLYLHKNRLKDASLIDKIYYDAHDKPYWFKSDEITQWLEDDDHDADLYTKRTPEPVAPIEPVEQDNSWHSVCRWMQLQGIMFELNVGNDEWGDGNNWNFDSGATQSNYRIKRGQPEPVGWQDTYSAAQARGMEFEVCDMRGESWFQQPCIFNGSFDSYRIKETI